ncbi:MAG: glucose-6-phosphate dehydrogenase [Oceanococcus sp.]|nr:MAG: glucose-6-phosphate dehydrogenase [Oceanococcus sp.]
MAGGENFDMVIFGGVGDLATRKLLPALYYLNRDGHFLSHSRVIACGRSGLAREAFQAHAEQACRRYVRAADLDDSALQSFLQRLDYVRVDAAEKSHFEALAETLNRQDPDRTRVYFLATRPDLFASLCENMAAAGLNTAASRVVLEKPLGTDLASANEINCRVGAVFAEEQIFRIDHYLGKETVQNLMALRFGNALFEPLWRRTNISDVQITVAEQVGVEGRADYYDSTGAMRDMVQNHLLQLLCMFAMEPPCSNEANAVRDEKLKVLRALKPLAGQAALSHTVRGQYRAGAINGQAVPGYLDEDGVATDSSTETYALIKAHVDTWRWAGVPFYLRSGKRLAERRAEIVVNFRPVPLNIFSKDMGSLPVNRMVIRLHPDEGVRLNVLAKQPGPAMRLKPVSLHLDFASTFKVRPLDAYERLLTEVIRGNLTLFMRNDELEAAWRWVDPIIAAWQDSGEPPRSYNAGSWGPSSAVSLLARDGMVWHEEVEDAR